MQSILKLERNPKNITNFLKLALNGMIQLAMISETNEWLILCPDSPGHAVGDLGTRLLYGCIPYNYILDKPLLIL